MTAYRWERERGATVLGRSRAGTSARRRAELLQRQARRSGRAGTGVGASGMHEELTPPLWRRIATGTVGGTGGPKWKLFKIVVVTVAVVLFLHVMWPAMVLAWLAYRALDERFSPRLGRRMWTHVAPALAAVSVALLAAAAWAGWLAMPGASMFNHAPLGGVFTSPAVWWWTWQLGLFPLLTAYLIWAWGWDGVPSDAVKRPEKNSDGSFREVKQSDKIALDVFDGETKSDDVIVVRRKPDAAPPDVPEPPKFNLLDDDEPEDEKEKERDDD